MRALGQLRLLGLPVPIPPDPIPEKMRPAVWQSVLLYNLPTVKEGGPEGKGSGSGSFTV